MSGSADQGRHPALPQLRLDQLLDELQARLDAARSTQDRMHNFLEAVLSVGRELDLEQVLRRIVESAVVLADAEYGALDGVIDRHRLSQFLPVGISEERAHRIEPVAQAGHGLLGELIRHPQVAATHRSVGASGELRLPRAPSADALLPGRADPGP
ncbi:hypothetical protein SANTM175S_10548 [Streptomyces antimycoticus]